MSPSVQLLATCLVDTLFPEVGEAVMACMGRLGIEVHLPSGQTCCGQPAYNGGYRDLARSMARHTIEVFARNDLPVLIPSGSCTSMIRHGYPDLFSADPVWLPKATELAQRSFEFSEFLVDRLGRTDLGGTSPGRLAYHPSCHTLRGLGVDRQPMALLTALKGGQLERLSNDCCGFGGLFAVENEPISSAMLERRLGQIEESRAELVVSCDVSCLMHLEGGLRKAGSPARCVHLAQVLAGKTVGLR